MITLKHLKTLQHVSILISGFHHAFLKSVTFYWPTDALRRLKSTLYQCFKRQLKTPNLVRHTSPHRTHLRTPNVMLPHHHIDFYILNKF
jgi:hypothetical protein